MKVRITLNVVYGGNSSAIEDLLSPQDNFGSLQASITHVVENGLLSNSDSYVKSWEMTAEGICTEHNGPFDDNPGKSICKTCEDWLSPTEAHHQWFWKVTDQTSAIPSTQSFTIAMTRDEVLVYLTERYPTAPGFNVWPSEDN